MSRSPLGSLLGNLAALAVSLTVTLLLAELVVRIVAPQQLILIRPDIWQPVDTLGWMHRPDVRTTINTGERTVPVRTDREGFRVGERGRIEAPRTLMLIGDSYPEAFQVPYEESFPGLLEARFGAAGGAVGLRNVSSGGWDPNHYLFAIRRYLPRDPSSVVVVCVFVGNDIVDSRVDAYSPRPAIDRHSFRLPQNMTPREWARAFLLPVNDWLETRSQLYILVRNRLGNLRMKLGLAPATGLPDVFLKRYASAPDWGITADILRDVDSVARADGARALFVLIPAAYQVYPAIFERWRDATKVSPADVDADQPDRRMREELEARGLAVFDALPGLRAAAGKGGPPLYGTVDAHLSVAGHAELATLMQPVVEVMFAEAEGPKAARRAAPTQRPR